MRRQCFVDDQRRAAEQAPVVVEDHQSVGAGAQLAAQRTPAVCAQWQARGVVCARCEHDSGTACEHAGFRHLNALLVHCQRHRAQTHAPQQCEQRWPAGVFDGDSVTWAGVLAQCAFDGIQCAGEHTDGCVAWQALRGQPLAAEGEQVCVVFSLVCRLAHGIRLHAAPATGAQARQERVIHMSAGEIAQTLWHVVGRGDWHGFTGYPRTASARSDEPPRVTQACIGRCDRIGIDTQLRCQMPHGRQRVADLQRAAAQRRLDAASNVLSTASLNIVD